MVAHLRPRTLLVAVVALLSLQLAGCTSGPTGSIGFLQLTTLADDPTPRAASSCDELLDALNARALAEADAALQDAVDNEYWYGYWRGDVAVDFAASADSSEGSSPAALQSSKSSTAATSTGSGSGAQATGTNNQESEADEGDFLKTDGTWTYVLSAGQLYILRHPILSQVELVGQIAIGESWNGGFLLLERGALDDESDDRLVVITSGSTPVTAAGVALTDEVSQKVQNGMTRILVLGLADRAKPTTLSETLVEGYPAAVRLVHGVAHVVVSHYGADIGLQSWLQPTGLGVQAKLASWGVVDPAPTDRADREQMAAAARALNDERIAKVTLRDHLPLVMTAEDGKASPEPLGEAQCADVLAVPGPTGRSATTILSVDVADTLDHKTLQVMAPAGIVYASGDSLVLASPSADLWWAREPAQDALPETTDLHWFNLDGIDVTHRASGRAVGSVHDTFALDVHGDQLRVATTLNLWSWRGDAPMTSQMVSLKPVAGTLVPTGIVAGLAPGERLYGVRFTDDRAYLVTFRQMDPLWVIDLSGDVPELLAELEVPGVSTYLHPLDDGALLAIGYPPASEDGLGADRSKAQVSLFDVSDPRNPRLAATAQLMDQDDDRGYGYSSALDEHKAFTYWADIGRLAVPVTSWGTNGYVSELRFVKVDREALTLDRAGAINQTQLAEPQAGYYRGYGSGIERSFFLGFPVVDLVSVYAVSQQGITGHDLATLAPQGHVAFDVPDYGSPYGYAID